MLEFEDKGDVIIEKEAEEAKLIRFLTEVGRGSFWVHSNAQKISEACAQAAALLIEKNRMLLMRGNTTTPKDLKYEVMEARLEEAVRDKQAAERELQAAFTRGVIAGMQKSGTRR